MWLKSPSSGNQLVLERREAVEGSVIKSISHLLIHIQHWPSAIIIQELNYLVNNHATPLCNSRNASNMSQGNMDNRNNSNSLDSLHSDQRMVVSVSSPIDVTS